MNQKFYLILIVLFVSGLVLAACGETTKNHPAAVGPTSSVQSSNDLATLPLGSYSTVLKARDFHPEFGADAPALRNYFGLWELKLAEQNRFSLVLNNQALAEGDYQLSPDQIYFNASASWPSICEDNPETTTAVYSWRLEGTTLALSGKDTACSVKGLVFSHLLDLSGQETLH